MDKKRIEFLEAIEELRGKKCLAKLDIPDTFYDALSKNGIGYNQFNELLLNLGFGRISKEFFTLLVSLAVEFEQNGRINSVDHFVRCVEEFIKLGIFLYGNKKFAYKKMSGLSDIHAKYLFLTKQSLKPVLETEFDGRHDPIRPIERIPGDKTFLLGFLVDKILNKIKENNQVQYERLNQEKRRYLKIGKNNQKAYLMSDHLDVYIATSMREMHEYYFVNKFSEKIFSSDLLRKMKLRYFDPTQAYCCDRVDKGLAEALMLKRANCTIYFVQETDTLGKDSELAATLAQGKTVIAYIPEVTHDFFKETLQDLVDIYSIYGDCEQDIFINHLKILKPELAWEDKKVQGWIVKRNQCENVDLHELSNKLEVEMKAHYDSRANNLMNKHPLGIQVNLNSGVANGVLVVRSLEDCARLVKSVLTKQMEFYLKREMKGGKIYYELREKVSNCIFRISTGDELLTNAFWNYYNRQ
jgi:hypothetical protein